MGVRKRIRLDNRVTHDTVRATSLPSSIQALITMSTQFPKLTESQRIARLEPPAGKVRIVLDTDTYNEIDDQFAVVQALLSPEKIDVEAIHAAPFHNTRSNGPEQGMERSYEEILRVLQRLGREPDDFVFEGSRSFMTGPEDPVESPAARDLISRAMRRNPEEEPLYVVAIGAPTNVSSALLLEPGILERIVVVWLGGQPHHWHSAHEFNFKQDLHATRVLFDSGVPLVQVPCAQVAQQINTTLSEMTTFVKGQGAIGDYLHQIFADYFKDHYARSKVIWDIATIAWILNPQWAPSYLTHSPHVSEDFRYSFNPGRHLIRVISECRRDPIFGDLFRKIEAAGKAG